MSGELITLLVSGFGIPLALRIIAHYVPWLDILTPPARPPESRSSTQEEK